MFKFKIFLKQFYLLNLLIFILYILYVINNESIDFKLLISINTKIFLNNIIQLYDYITIKQ